MEASVDTFASSHNQKDNKFKNKNQPELPENRTVWKSDNQRVKETLIQTGRRGGDGQLDGDTVQQGGSWRARAGEAVAGGPVSPTFVCR